MVTATCSCEVRADADAMLNASVATFAAVLIGTLETPPYQAGVLIGAATVTAAALARSRTVNEAVQDESEQSEARATTAEIHSSVALGDPIQGLGEFARIPMRTNKNEARPTFADGKSENAVEKDVAVSAVVPADGDASRPPIPTTCSEGDLAGKDGNPGSFIAVRSYFVPAQGKSSGSVDPPDEAKHTPYHIIPHDGGEWLFKERKGGHAYTYVCGKAKGCPAFKSMNSVLNDGWTVEYLCNVHVHKASEILDHVPKIQHFSLVNGVWWYDMGKGKLLPQLLPHFEKGEQESENGRRNMVLNAQFVEQQLQRQQQEQQEEEQQEGEPNDQQQQEEEEEQQEEEPKGQQQQQLEEEEQQQLQEVHQEEPKEQQHQLEEQQEEEPKEQQHQQHQSGEEEHAQLEIELQQDPEQTEEAEQFKEMDEISLPSPKLYRFRKPDSYTKEASRQSETPLQKTIIHHRCCNRDRNQSPCAALCFVYLDARQPDGGKTVRVTVLYINQHTCSLKKRNEPWLVERIGIADWSGDAVEIPVEMPVEDEWMPEPDGGVMEYTEDAWPAFHGRIGGRRVRRLVQLEGGLEKSGKLLLKVSYEAMDEIPSGLEIPDSDCIANCSEYVRTGRYVMSLPSVDRSWQLVSRLPSLNGFFLRQHSLQCSSYMLLYPDMTGRGDTVAVYKRSGQSKNPLYDDKYLGFMQFRDGNSWSPVKLSGPDGTPVYACLDPSLMLPNLPSRSAVRKLSFAFEAPFGSGSRAAYLNMKAKYLAGN